MNPELLYKTVYAIFNNLVSKVSTAPLFPEEETASRLEEAFSLDRKGYNANLVNSEYGEYVSGWAEAIGAFFGMPKFDIDRVYFDPLKFAENIALYHKVYALNDVDKTSSFYFHPKRFGLENEADIITKEYIAAGVALSVPLIMSFMHTAPLKGERKFTIPHVDIELDLYRVDEDKDEYNVVLDSTGNAFKVPMKSPCEAVLVMLMDELLLSQVFHGNEAIILCRGLDNCAEFSALIHDNFEAIADDYAKCNKDKVAFEYFLSEIVPMHEAIRF